MPETEQNLEPVASHIQAEPVPSHLTLNSTAVPVPKGAQSHALVPQGARSVPVQAGGLPPPPPQSEETEDAADDFVSRAGRSAYESTLAPLAATGNAELDAIHDQWHSGDRVGAVGRSMNLPLWAISTLVRGIGEGHANEFQRAYDLASNGHNWKDYLESTSHAVAGVVPGVGPWVSGTTEKAAKEVGSGEYAKAIGTVGANVALAAAPKLFRGGEAAVEAGRVATEGIKAVEGAVESHLLKEPEFSGNPEHFVTKDYLPEESGLYHVTTAKDKVVAEGLKPRSQTKSVGLGGGFANQSPDKISVTFDEAHANVIAERLRLASEAARDKISPRQALDRMIRDGQIPDDFPEPVASALGAPESTYEEWEAFDKWFDENYKHGDAYSVVQDLDDALSHIFSESDTHSGRVGLTASKKQMALVDPEQIDILKVEGKRGSKPEHIPDEMELRFHPDDIRIKKEPVAPVGLHEDDLPRNAKYQSVDWSARDLQDSVNRVGEENIRQTYANGDRNASIYKAHIPMEDLPSPTWVNPEEAEFDRGEYAAPRVGVPIKVRVTPKGKLEILDGNHRAQVWEEQGHEYAPAWVVDERAPNIENLSEDEKLERGTEESHLTKSIREMTADQISALTPAEFKQQFPEAKVSQQEFVMARERAKAEKISGMMEREDQPIVKIGGEYFDRSGKPLKIPEESHLTGKLDAYSQYERQFSDSSTDTWNIGGAEIRKVSAIPDFVETRNLPKGRAVHAWTQVGSEGPTIYIKSGLTPGQFQEALQHELEHVSKKDYPTFAQEYPELARPEETHLSAGDLAGLARRAPTIQGMAEQAGLAPEELINQLSERPEVVTQSAAMLHRLLDSKESLGQFLENPRASSTLLKELSSFERGTWERMHEISSLKVLTKHMNEKVLPLLDAARMSRPEFDAVAAHEIGHAAMLSNPDLGFGNMALQKLSLRHKMVSLDDPRLAKSGTPFVSAGHVSHSLPSNLTLEQGARARIALALSGKAAQEALGHTAARDSLLADLSDVREQIDGLTKRGWSEERTSTLLKEVSSAVSEYFARPGMAETIERMIEHLRERGGEMNGAEFRKLLGKVSDEKAPISPSTSFDEVNSQLAHADDLGIAGAPHVHVEEGKQRLVTKSYPLPWERVAAYAALAPKPEMKSNRTLSRAE